MFVVNSNWSTQRTIRYHVCGGRIPASWWRWAFDIWLDICLCYVSNNSKILGIQQVETSFPFRTSVHNELAIPTNIFWTAMCTNIKFGRSDFVWNSVPILYATHFNLLNHVFCLNTQMTTAWDPIQCSFLKLRHGNQGLSCSPAVKSWLSTPCYGVLTEILDCALLGLLSHGSGFASGDSWLTIPGYVLRQI